MLDETKIVKPLSVLRRELLNTVFWGSRQSIEEKEGSRKKVADDHQNNEHLISKRRISNHSQKMNREESAGDQEFGEY